MSHTTIYFLVQAEDQENAESKVLGYLESVHHIDSPALSSDKSGSLVYKRPELMNYIKNWNWMQVAENFLHQAQKYKESGDLRLYGQHLVSAGELYSQNLTICTYVFNIDSDDYSVPDEDMGWWAIGVDSLY
jgi:hypothetical protein